MAINSKGLGWIRSESIGYGLLTVVVCWALTLSGCSSRKLVEIYDPQYLEQMQKESGTKDLHLPPSLNLNPGDEFTIPGKIDEKLAEYRKVFSIFSNNRNFSFRSDGQGKYWLATNAEVKRLWLGIKQYFYAEGLEIDYENFVVGEMRTHWAENLARNRYYDAVFHHADRYLITVLPAERSGWINVHIQHQGLIRDLRAESLTDDGKSDSGQGAQQDKILKSYLRSRQAVWAPSPEQPLLALEMLTRLCVFLGAPEDETRVVRREQVVGVLGRIYLERNEFGDISLVIGDNLPRTYFYLVKVMNNLSEFTNVQTDDQQFKKLLFSVRDDQRLSPDLPEDIYLYFVRNGEYIKLLLFDQQDNVVNPVLAEQVYRLLIAQLRAKYIETSLDDIELLDTRNLLPSKAQPAR